MSSCDNKPSIYLWLQINGDALGVNNLLFRSISIPNNKEISSKGSVGRSPTTTCPETKSDFKDKVKTFKEYLGGSLDNHGSIDNKGCV
jgi:hypothetical protein